MQVVSITMAMSFVRIERKATGLTMFPSGCYWVVGMDTPPLTQQLGIEGEAAEPHGIDVSSDPTCVPGLGSIVATQEIEMNTPLDEAGRVAYHKDRCLPDALDHALQTLGLTLRDVEELTGPQAFTGCADAKRNRTPLNFRRRARLIELVGRLATANDAHAETWLSGKALSGHSTSRVNCSMSSALRRAT